MCLTEVKILCETLIDEKTSYLLNEVNNEFESQIKVECSADLDLEMQGESE